MNTNSISPEQQQLNEVFLTELPVTGLMDTVIIVFTLVACLVTLPLLHSFKPANVLIYKENSVVATYPLDTDRTISIDGVLGRVSIAIKKQSVAIIQSDCPQHLCQKTGAIRHPHAQIVCAPNHLLITITSAVSDSIDGIAR